MKTVKRILPVICITVITVIISQLLYAQMMKREKDRCMKELSSAAESVNKEITTKFEDEITKLRLIGEIMVEDNVYDMDNIERLHLGSVQPATIFTRIDILFPDNTFICNGKRQDTYEFDFDDIVSRGEHLSHRTEDPVTQRPCVYYALPITRQGEITEVLVGVIDAKSLSDVFRPTIYEGRVNICIVDAEDGNYIMDSWHDELENAYNTADREKLRGYENIDLKSEVRNFRTGAIAFVSQTTGRPIYMYYTPVNMFGWELLIFATDDVLFANLFSLRKLFVIAGIAEVLLLILYFAWNLSIVGHLEKSNSEIEKQKKQLEYLSYTDVMTSLNNRHKYIETLTALENKQLESVGIAYMDLNGLKQVNDRNSHAAGDKYIRGAAKVLAEVFGENCYRIGGDEFVVLVCGIGKETFESKLEKLRETAQRENISFSAGALWESKCSDLDEMIKQAEKQMYSEKRKFYENHDGRPAENA